MLVLKINEYFTKDNFLIYQYQKKDFSNQNLNFLTYFATFYNLRHILSSYYNKKYKYSKHTMLILSKLQQDLIQYNKYDTIRVVDPFYFFLADSGSFENKHGLLKSGYGSKALKIFLCETTFAETL